MKIIEAMNDSGITIKELATLISVSPALAARLSGLANSGCAGNVSDLRVAIIRVLGLDLVKS
jgi:HD-like signal output (HDOD) protein